MLKDIVAIISSSGIVEDRHHTIKLYFVVLLEDHFEIEPEQTTQSRTQARARPCVQVSFYHVLDTRVCDWSCDPSQ
ncbi:hypothetical protein F383_13788 [Gossypium arboreum]|uniref:Uncharacterized protein n=1 Tax=Gossypium arboreum TaxID=29729 RepID=A0A0B0NGB3_GOSAR|nr:hypothetical protein F383_13788 [Gossypium arboreum]